MGDFSNRNNLNSGSSRFTISIPSVSMEPFKNCTMMTVFPFKRAVTLVLRHLRSFLFQVRRSPVSDFLSSFCTSCLFSHVSIFQNHSSTIYVIMQIFLTISRRFSCLNMKIYLKFITLQLADGYFISNTLLTFCLRDLLCILPALDSSPDTDPCSNLKARSKTGITAPADTRDII